MTPQDLQRHLEKLDAAPPLTVSFARELAEIFPTLQWAWWSTQKEHWLGWLQEYNGPGYYGRSNWDVTAKAVHNRVGNPAMVLWLGEAAAHTRQTSDRRSATCWQLVAHECGAIRRVIPWEDIEAKLLPRSRS